MTHHRVKRARQPPPSPKRVGAIEDAGLRELDRFSALDLERWRRVSADLDELHRQLYYGLEPQRAARRSELIESLRRHAAEPVVFTGWHRIVNYRFSLSPLSALGSMLVEGGGRFNVGRDLGGLGFASWPALYLAESFETAFREKFGLRKGEGVDGLTPEELALTKADGFADVRVSGCLNSVFDVGNRDSLEDFARVIAKFKMPAKARTIARRFGARANEVFLIR